MVLGPVLRVSPHTLVQPRAMRAVEHGVLMARWSGRGIPPTRRQLHRFRQAQVKERAADAKEQKSMLSKFDFSWNKKARKVIINAEQFERLWCS